MTLAERIKSARTQLGFTQAALARKCGISQPSLHDLESGKSKSMRQSTLLRMAKALGQPLEWLAFGSGILQDPATPVQYSSFEQEFLDDFRKLSATERKIVIRIVRSLIMDR